MSRAVIDQPGFRVLTVGLVLSLVLGFSLRAQISSSRVEKSLEKSIQILEKDFRIDFELAEVRLSKWGLPLPHLIINRLRISPKKDFCQNSQIFIDELELPLHLKNIFTSEKTINFIRAKNVEIRLVDLEACLAKSQMKKAKKTEVSETETALEASEAARPAAKKGEAEYAAMQTNIFSQSTGTRLKEIAIDQLKIISHRNYDQPIVFKQLRFFLNYDQSKLSQIDIKSRLYSIKDSRTDIYFLISDLNAHVKPDQNKHVEMELQLKGRLLDGDIQVFVKGSTLNQKLSYDVTSHNVSIKAYGPLVKRNKKDVPLERWPLSISFYLQGEMQQTEDFKAFAKFKNFQATGDNMSVSAPEIDFEFFNHQTSLKPFQVSLNRIPLSPFKTILADQFDFQSSESLGLLSGLFKFEDATRWNFLGDIKNTELIFSNRGSREIEAIDSATLAIDSSSKGLDFKLDNISIQQNEILGGLEGEYVKDSKALQLKLNIEGKVLNEKIWKQFTQVAQNPSVSLLWNYKKTNEERHQIKINSPELVFQGFRLSDVQIDFLQLIDNETKSLALSLKTAKALIQGRALRPNFANAFFNEETGLDPASDYTALKTQVGLQGSDWKNMVFDLDLNLYDLEGVKALEHLKARGEWKSDESLIGTSTLQNPRRTLKFDIFKNARDELDFRPEKKAE